jgi:Ca2+-binding EF-hand superfamily protein
MEDRGAEVVMTRAEAKTRAETAFDKLDVNHDGKLDKADREARHLARINAHFDALDTNHDGSISRDEFLAAHTGPKAPEMDHDMGAPGEHPDGPPPHGRMGPHGAPRMARMAAAAPMA